MSTNSPPVSSCWGARRDPPRQLLESALDTLTRVYDLTDAEKRVARALGVSVATVRTHLHSLYEKCGARRQADLVTLLRGFASPFG